MSFWSGKRVLLTGGHGFLGSFLRERLATRDAESVLAPDRLACDLRDRAAVARCLKDARPDVVIHAAAVVGGIGANLAHPGRFFFENAIMGLQLIEEARLAGVEKIVCLGTVCGYPKWTAVPFREEDLWNGYPDETNAPYGLAKKMLLVQLQAYRREYGLNGIFLLPVNLYGPRDDFDSENNHVIPAMIRRFAEACDTGAQTVVLWGDGSSTREFLYVEDAAEGVLRAAEAYDAEEPVNLGSGEEIPIRDLAERIARGTGFRGRVVWDASYPNGQPRRRLDTSRAKERFGWKAHTTLEEGLKRTVAWYREHRVRAAVI